MSRREQADFLDEIVAESDAMAPGFAAKVDAAYHRRVMGHALSALREALGLTLMDVARRMRASQPVVSRLEAGADVRVSTLTRYLEAVGIPPDWPERFAAAK